MNIVLRLALPAMLLAPLVAQETTQKPAGTPLRLLVVPATDAGLRADVTREVVERITTALARQGVAVVDAAHAAQLASHSEKAFLRFVGEAPKEQTAESALGIAADADLVVTAGVSVEQEVQQQGRYKVRDRLRVRVVGSEDSAIGWNEAFDGTGQSLDSYLIAHRVAVESMCSLGDADSAIGKLVKLVQETAAREAERGTSFRVVVHSDREDADLIAALSRGLGEAAVADTLQQVGGGRSGDAATGVREFAEFSLRYRGSGSELQSRIAKALDGTPVAEGMVRQLSFLGSRRRLDLVVRTRKLERSLAAEVETMVQGAVQDLVSRNEAGLQGKKIAVLATDLPGTDQTGTGKAVGDRAPTLAKGIADWLRGALQTTAQKVAEVLPDDAEQAKAIEVISKEAEQHREQGSVDPATIAFLQRSGAGVAVMSSLREVLQRFQLVVSMVDLNTGATVRHVSVVPETFHAELSREVGGN